MRISTSSALALLLFLASSSTTTIAFVVIPQPSSSSRLQYRNHDGYDVVVDFETSFEHVFHQPTEEFVVNQRYAPSDTTIDSPYYEVEIIDDDEEEDDDDSESRFDADEPQSSSNGPRSIWDTSTVQTLSGGAQRSWTMDVPQVNHVQMLLKNDGVRPLSAKADVLCGPGSARMQIAVYSEDGSKFPFSCIIPTPGESSHSIQVKNTGPPNEDPVGVVVMADMEQLYSGRPSDASLGSLVEQLHAFGKGTNIPGDGMIETYGVRSDVQSVQILIRSEYQRPCNARIELTNSGNVIQQVIEVFVEDGQARPFFVVVETPGVQDYTIRVVNVGDQAFPITSCVEPFFVNDEGNDRKTASSSTSTSPYGYHESEHLHQHREEETFFYAE
jgi:hypothetical protein